MTNVAALRAGPPATIITNDKALHLASRTIWKHLVGAELDIAREFCRFYGANPFVGDIHFFVFDANDADKRRVVPVLTIQQYRKNAARSGNFRPSSVKPQFSYDTSLIGPANPRGIVDCTVTLHQYAHGEWHDVVGYVRWDERAPIVEKGAEGERWEETDEVYPPGHKKAGQKKFRKVQVGERVPTLDPKKSNWATMAETMLAKCAEADGIRKGWPEQTSGSYVEGELDRAEVLELSAEEIIQKADTETRQAKLGGPRILVQWEATAPLVGVPVGEFHARADEFIKSHKDEPSVIGEWAVRNREALKEFWALDKNASLDLKQKIEAAACL